MRVAILILCVASCVTTVSQTTEFSLMDYLAPQYVASTNAPSMIVIPGRHEPGERSIVAGRPLNDTKPVAEVSLNVFHTDINARYAPTSTTAPASTTRGCTARRARTRGAGTNTRPLVQAVMTMALLTCITS
jgi:hypothetical protein